MSRLLSDAEIADLLASNSQIAQAVQAVSWASGSGFGYWPNGASATQGWYVVDPKYGGLLIAQNQGDGRIVYNADLPGYLNTAAINAPQYLPPDTSPGPTVCPGWSNIGSIEDLLACLSQGASGALSTLELVAVAVVAYVVYRETR